MEIIVAAESWVNSGHRLIRMTHCVRSPVLASIEFLKFRVICVALLMDVHST
jgi:hypothetical protein